MVGQYPGENPEIEGPTADDVENHIQTLMQDAKVGLFCSLQSELPCQSSTKEWQEEAKGEIYLDSYYRKQFPNPFTHYAPLVQPYHPDCQFLHAPIEDLSVPSSSESLQELLLQLLTTMEENQNQATGQSIYVHCWGGRGRAGLVSACLLSLLYPTVDATAILDLVQAGYDSRAGSEDMPLALSKSPQTESQRQFVRQFVQERQRHYQQHQL